jgi:hypothetical protein
VSKKTLIAATIITAFLISIAGVQVEVAKANPVMMPETPPSGIHIENNGTITGTTKIQRSGTSYSLIGNIDKPLVVLCSNITIDGSGYSLQGQNSSTGLFIQGPIANVTIKNMKITNFTYGIKLTNIGVSGPRNITVLNSTITYNTQIGILLDVGSSSNSLIGNNITGN